MGDLIVRELERQYEWPPDSASRWSAPPGAAANHARILEERKFPVRELRAFASSCSVGKTVTSGRADRFARIGRRVQGVEIAFCWPIGAVERVRADDRQGRGTVIESRTRSG